MGAPPRAWDGQAQLRFSRQGLMPALWLVLAGLRCTLGGRNENGDSVAVDTAAHFHKRTASGSHLQNSGGESDMIERLGHEIAEQLAGMHRDGSHNGADERPSDESLLQEQQPGESRSHSGADGLDDLEEMPAVSPSAALLQRLERISPASHMEAAPAIAHMAHASTFAARADAPDTLAPVSQRSMHGSQVGDFEGADGILAKLANLSKELDATSALEKTADASARVAMDDAKHLQKPSDVFQGASWQGSESDVPSDLSSQQDMARLFQPSPELEKPTSMMQSWSGHVHSKEVAVSKRLLGAQDNTAMELHELKVSVARDLAKAKTLVTKEQLKHHRRGLDGVAGDLLQLEQAVVHDQILRSGIDKCPTFDFLDKNNDGSIPVDKFKSFLSPTVSDADALVKKLDVDSSFKIDRQEYDDAVKDKVITRDDFHPDILAAADGKESAANQRSRPSNSMFLVSLVFLWTLT